MDIRDLKNHLNQHAAQICLETLPEGKKEGDCWKVGSIDGEKGRSFSCQLSGADAGKWIDFATGDHGDLLDLISITQKINLQESMTWAKRRFGIKETEQQRKIAPAKKITAKKAWLPQADSASPNLHNFLDSRGFTNLGELVEKWRIYESKEMKTKGSDLIFPFFHIDGTVPFCKSKPLNYEGSPRITSPEQKPILYGWHTIPESVREILICEGELDAIAATELGLFALSVPAGASNFKWLQTEFHNLDRFEHIGVATDQDEQGEKCAATLIRKLGDRAFRVNWEGGKDINDLLMKFGADKARLIVKKAIEDSKWVDPEQLKSVLDFREDLDTYFDVVDTTGFRAGWEKLDNKDFRFRPGELWGIVGYNGSGKSLFIGQVILNCIEQKQKCLIASMEMKPPRLLGRIMKQAAGSGRPPQPYRNSLLDWMSQYLWLFVDDLTPRFEDLIKTFEYAYKRYDINVFVVDSLTNLVGQDDYARQQKILEALVNFKLKYNITIFLITHARKGENESKAPNKFDVKGSGSISDLADGFMSVWKNKKKLDHLETCELLGREPDSQIAQGWDFYLHVLKNRNGSFEGQVGFDMHGDSLQYHGKRNAPSRQYIKYSKEST